MLEGDVLDLRGRRHRGRVWTRFETKGGGYIFAGIVGGASGSGAFALPFALPVLILPGGSSALAICSAFGRALADHLIERSPSAPAGSTPAHKPAPTR
jgi:hypothetical protein